MTASATLSRNTRRRTSGRGRVTSIMSGHRARGTRYVAINTPFGDFALVEGADGSLWSEWLHLRGAPTGARPSQSLRPGVIALLERYFAGEADVDFGAVETPVGPPFFRRCWEACRRIPRGETWSYARLALEAGGQANAARAAGQAMRRNPLPVIIPCHRVVARDGSLHGFAGSCDAAGPEMALKTALLRLERTVTETGHRQRG